MDMILCIDQLILVKHTTIGSTMFNLMLKFFYSADQERYVQS